MTENSKIRWGWLKFMYLYTVIGAGGFGLGMVFAPDLIISMLKFPGQDPIVFGAFGCMLISSGILALLGLRSPLKFVPLLLFQLFYKSIWFIAVLLPFLLANELQFYVIVFIGIFASYIIGDLIAIPFSYIFGKESDRST
jgi:hypothetical protein